MIVCLTMLRIAHIRLASFIRRMTNQWTQSRLWPADQGSLPTFVGHGGWMVNSSWFLWWAYVTTHRDSWINGLWELMRIVDFASMCIYLPSMSWMNRKRGSISQEGPCCGGRWGRSQRQRPWRVRRRIRMGLSLPLSANILHVCYIICYTYS